VRLQDNESSVAIDLISANALVLNGTTLSNLSLAAGQTTSAAAMASWLNSASAATGVSATASNIIELDASGIDFTQQLTINNVTIGDGSLLTSADQLANAINWSQLTPMWLPL